MGDDGGDDGGDAAAGRRSARRGDHRDGHVVRPIDRWDQDAVHLIATRMGDTLAEVLGEGRGRSMYRFDELVARVQHHLDPEACTGEVFVALDGDGHICGHTIVRLEPEESEVVGLFSTIHVVEDRRGRGIASLLLDAGERWMRQRSMTTAATWTHPGNEPLLGLLRSRGWSVTPQNEDFVRVHRAL